MTTDPDQNNDLEESQKRFPYHYFEQTYISKIHHFYLSSIIDEPSQYINMIHQIRTALPEDTIYLHLNVQGGALSTGIQIINALQSTQAHIICSLEAEAHSLGTMILLSADEFIIHDNCTMLFHNFSSGTFGKGNEQVAQLESTIRWFNTLVKQLYIPFLTEEEVQGILKGEDLWLHSEQIRTRLEKMVRIMEKQIRDNTKSETSKTTKKPSNKKVVN
jgi:ATP-dependent protease ClpP protease subunit